MGSDWNSNLPGLYERISKLRCRAHVKTHVDPTDSDIAGSFRGARFLSVPLAMKGSASLWSRLSVLACCQSSASCPAFVAFLAEPGLDSLSALVMLRRQPTGLPHSLLDQSNATMNRGAK